MHPQMQNVFIKKIVKFLNDVKIEAQVIITTHSPHILAASNFNSIRYFTHNQDTITASVKDLMKFNEDLPEKEKTEFLQQYLTLGKCDLFFADKAILFEGTVERILLPIFIEKVETESNKKLSEQYISSIEIGGAYISKFKELLEFLSIKTLIITDIDSVAKPGFTKNKVEKGKDLLTSNVTLKEWIPGKEKIDELLDDKIQKVSDDGMIFIAYQTTIDHVSTDIKCGRSFEEAFILENTEYVFDNKAKFQSIKNKLKNYNSSDEIKNNSFEIQNYIDENRKKTEFAFDLLSVNKNNWVIPTYIKEGLLWLAK
jgi:putative ATP-dependent endonuclease of the OLD family